MAGVDKVKGFGSSGKTIDEILRELGEFKCEIIETGDIELVTCKDYKLDELEAKEDKNGRIVEIIERSIDRVISTYKFNNNNTVSYIIRYTRENLGRKDDSYYLEVELRGSKESNKVFGRITYRSFDDSYYYNMKFGPEIKDFYNRVINIVNNKDKQEADRLASEIISTVQRLSVIIPINEFVSTYTRLYGSK